MTKFSIRSEVDLEGLDALDLTGLEQLLRELYCDSLTKMIKVLTHPVSDSSHQEYLVKAQEQDCNVAKQFVDNLVLEKMKDG